MIRDKNQLSFFDEPSPPQKVDPEVHVGQVWSHKYEWMKFGRLVTIYLIGKDIISFKRQDEIMCCRLKSDFFREAKAIC